MVNDDVLYGSGCGCSAWRRSSATSARPAGSMGVHPSTYYRWREPVLRIGPRDAPPARAPATADAQPDEPAHRAADRRLRPGPSRASGPRRISATLAQERWGGIVVSPNGVWRVLRRHGLSRRISRLSLVAGYAAPPEPEGRPPEPERHVEVDHPGELVGFDCFHVGPALGHDRPGLAVHRDRPRDAATSGPSSRTTPLNPSARQDVGPRPAGRGRPARPTAGASSGSSPTTAPSSAAQVFGDTVRELGAPADLHPGRAARRPTAPSSGSSGRSSRSAGGRRSRGASCPSSPGSTRDLDGVPALLQRGARPHRAADPGPDPRRRRSIGARKMRPR